MSADRVTRPWQAVAAFWGYVAAAVVTVLIGVAVAVLIPPALRAHAKTAVQLAAAEQRLPLIVAVVLVITLVYAAALVVLALRFRAGRGWARSALLMVSLLSLFSVLGPGIGVIVLLAVADVLAFRPVVGRWLRSERGLAPA